MPPRPSFRRPLPVGPDSLLRMGVGRRLLLVALPLLALWLAVGWALDWSFHR